MRFRVAFGYPLRGPNRESALVAGSTTGFVVVAALRLGVIGAAVAVVPALLLVGYVGRIAVRSADGHGTLPAVRPVVDLLSLGLRLGVVAVAYAIVPLVYLGATQHVLVDAASPSSGSVDGYVFLAVSTSVLVVCGVFGYLLPAAMVRVAWTRSIRSMVPDATIRATVSDLSYLVDWTIAALVVSFAASLASVLVTADTRGGLVGIPLVVYATYVSVHVVARACGDERRTRFS